MNKVRKLNWLNKLIMWGSMPGMFVAMNACKEDNTNDQTGRKINPNEIRIPKLIQDSAMQANIVRDAFGPAKYNPQNISGAFDARFKNAPEIKNNPSPSIADSAGGARYAIYYLRADYGNPLPTNDTTTTTLYDESGRFINIIEELANLRAGNGK